MTINRLDERHDMAIQQLIPWLLCETKYINYHCDSYLRICQNFCPVTRRGRWHVWFRSVIQMFLQDGYYMTELTIGERELRHKPCPSSLPFILRVAFRFRQILVHRLGCRTMSQSIRSISQISHFTALNSRSNSEEQSRPFGNPP